MARCTSAGYIKVPPRKAHWKRFLASGTHLSPYCYQRSFFTFARNLQNATISVLFKRPLRFDSLREASSSYGECIFKQAIGKSYTTSTILHVDYRSSRLVEVEEPTTWITIIKLDPAQPLEISKFYVLTTTFSTRGCIYTSAALASLIVILTQHQNKPLVHTQYDTSARSVPVAIFTEPDVLPDRTQPLNLPLSSAVLFYDSIQLKLNDLIQLSSEYKLFSMTKHRLSSCGKFRISKISTIAGSRVGLHTSFIPEKYPGASIYVILQMLTLRAEMEILIRIINLNDTPQYVSYYDIS
ncbi:hypothetical protein NA56DRAFT_702795 [Hyaloscypha hepaticicola]|uniref:Uncharacterized protein n=1 Tax=Hyaloscypha hepaticicola TaxID=2082293 RepID=A0A2J6Q6D0_9HELO|nr:hypothetical protein NA56DRAFT_702795 [Hyaloscypha hepaticicola]